MHAEPRHATELSVLQYRSSHSARLLLALPRISSQTMDLCAREATQMMGGAACVRGGPGEKVERLYREVRVNAIAGGSEEVLIDLAMRQAKL